MILVSKRKSIPDSSFVILLEQVSPYLGRVTTDCLYLEGTVSDSRNTFMNCVETI